MASSLQPKVIVLVHIVHIKLTCTTLFLLAPALFSDVFLKLIPFARLKLLAVCEDTFIEH